MIVNVINKETEEIYESIECDWFEGNTTYTKSGKGVSSINFGDEYYLVEAEPAIQKDNDLEV